MELQVRPMDVLNTGRLDDGILTFSRDGVLLCTYALYIIPNFLNARGKGGKGGKRGNWVE